MTWDEIYRYEEWLVQNEKKKNTRIVGSYWRYLDRYLHNTHEKVDGMDWETRMKEHPMPKNIYLYG